MRVLVTGGSGLAGRAVEELISSENNKQESWYFASSSDADLRDLEATRSLFEKIKPTHVLHLAAKVGGLLMNIEQPVEMYNDNIKINMNVMECSKELSVKKLVSTLSMCIFPQKVTYPINEDCLHEGLPSQDLMGYAQSKRMVDIMNRLYNKQYGMMFTSLIPTNIFGPHDNYSLKNAHVIPALMHKIYLAKKNGTPLEVVGTGTALRQFIYSADFAKIAVWSIRNYESVEPLIVSVPESHEVSIRDVVTILTSAMNFEGEVVWKGGPDGQLKKTADITRLQTAMGEIEFTDFKVGIRQAAEWFVANYEKARK
eukprot:TRINITY_DN3058_c2_g1_i2.p1 TRINITY_DN3058_c2_g1~~TRINITY_DN3058_c2_g1_i2.p1  ORF type:complete len:327 (+),score=69.74 TRINITY_DN3058_c2_g1_i2:43-981(+)